MREIVRALPAPLASSRRILDLGCGTGAAGAAWALESGAAVEGVDRSAWAVSETRWTFRELGVRGTARRANLVEIEPEPKSAILAAFALNELDESARERLRLRWSRRSRPSLLVIEPLSRRIAPWWPQWVETFRAHGGHENEWRFSSCLPDPLARLDRAAGLDHHELTARTLYVG